MSAVPQPIPPAWAAGTAGPVPADAHGWPLLMRALTELDARELPGVLANPGTASPERIRTYVINWLAGHGLLDPRAKDFEEARAALELLDFALAPREDSGHRRLYLAHAPGPSPVPRNFAHTLDACRTANAKLAGALASCEEPHARAGAVVYVLVTRAGLCHKALVAAVLVALAGGQALYGVEGMHWVVVDVELDGSFQRRRVLLDAVCVAAWCGSRSYIASELGDVEPAGRMRAAIALVRRVWTTFVKALSDCKCALPALPHVMATVAGRITQVSVPLLGAYAAGKAAASSWAEPNWQALLGVAGNGSTTAAKKGASRRPHVSADGALVDDPVSRPIDEDPFLVGLRNATQPHEGRQRVVERLKQLRDTTPEGSTREVLVRWMHYLVEQARNKGKPLELATVHGYRAAIATRLVGILPEYLSDVSAEDLGDLLDEVVESATAPTLRHRLCELIRRFNAFRIREGIAVDGRIELPTRDGGECDVSARYITEQQYESALLHLHEGKDSTAALEARVFLILAYRFGLRRSEILGLTLGDVRRGDLDHDLVVRPNALRDLKTSNAIRRLPLALLSDTERREVHALRDVRCDAAKGPRSPNLSRHQYVFFHELTPAKWLLAAHPAPRTVLAALRFATGDEGLHVHHLRHSFATRLALGALISSCTKSAQQGLPNFMRAMPSQAKMFHALCRARRDPMARRFTTVSVAMGHGSDATTFQHYVHGLDAVLHAVMRAALPKPRKPRQADGQPVDPAAREARLICILLNRSADTRPPEGRLHAWLLGHCRRNGVAVEDLAPPTSPSGRTHALELDWALRQSAVRDLPGRPDSLATRRVVEAVLSALRAGFMRNPIATSQALEYLAREPVEAGWVVLTAAEVSGLQMAFRAACPGDLKLEYRLAARGKRRLATRSLAKALSTGACMEVRLRDPAADASTQRQRSWPAIAWAVRTAQVWASDHDL